MISLRRLDMLITGGRVVLVTLSSSDSGGTCSECSRFSFMVVVSMARETGLGVITSSATLVYTTGVMTSCIAVSITPKTRLGVPTRDSASRASYVIVVVVPNPTCSTRVWGRTSQGALSVVALTSLRVGAPSTLWPSCTSWVFV